VNSNRNCAVRQRRMLDHAGEERSRLPAEIREHMEQCRACRTFFEDIETMKEVFETTSPPGPPEDFASRVVAALRRKRDCRDVNTTLALLSSAVLLEALVLIPGFRRAALYVGTIIAAIGVRISLALSVVRSTGAAAWSSWRQVWTGLQHAAVGAGRLDWRLAVAAALCMGAAAFVAASRFPRTE